MKCWKEKSRKKPTIKRSVQVEKIDAIVENSEKLPSKIFEPVTTQELNKQEFKNPADTIQALHEDDKETILKIPKSSEKSELSKIPPEKVSTQVYNEKAIIKAHNVPGNSLCHHALSCGFSLCFLLCLSPCHFFLVNPTVLFLCL